MKIINTCLIALLILLLGIVYATKEDSRQDENTVTRYEWMEMLGEQFGTKEYNNSKPYFKDVNADSPYFKYVQSAVEWGIIENDRIFEGEKYANGEFIALTTMKAIGKYKVQIYLEMDKEPNKADYLDLTPQSISKWERGVSQT